MPGALSDCQGPEWPLPTGHSAGSSPSSRGGQTPEGTQRQQSPTPAGSMLPCRHPPSFHPRIPAPTPGTSDKLVQLKRLEGQNTQAWQTCSVTFKSRSAWRGGKRRVTPEHRVSPKSRSRSFFQPTPSTTFFPGVGTQAQLCATALSTSQQVTGHMKKSRELRARRFLKKPHLLSPHSAQVGTECS